MAKDERTYIRVHDGMPDHPKVVRAGGDAGWLNVCAQAWCSRNHTDGVLPAEALPRLSDRRTPVRLAGRLVEVGLWHDHAHPCPVGRCPAAGPDEYVIHDYTVHQRTASEIEERQEAKRLAGLVGNHKRWHIDRGIADPDCELCANPPAIPEGSQSPSHNRSQTGSQTPRKTSPQTETEKELPDSLRSSGGQRPQQRPADPIWDAVLAVCGVDPATIPTSARGAYNRAVADLRAVGATPADISRRARQYRSQWPNVTLTPTALARRWSELGPTRPPAAADVPSANGGAVLAALDAKIAAEREASNRTWADEAADALGVMPR